MSLSALPGQLPLAAQNDPALAHARKLLRSTPLIDGHNDLAWEIRVSPTAPGDVAAYNLRARTPGQTDLERLRARRGLRC